MKAKLLRAAAILLAGAALCAACGNQAAATTMKLAGTEGDTYVRDEEEKELEPAADLKLYSGYALETEKAGYLWINLDNVKLAKMDQLSNVGIQKSGKDLELSLQSGNLFFHVTEPLEEDETMNIRSSTMAVGIRGTCGWAEVPETGHMRVYLLEGTVECSITDPDTGEVLAESVTEGEWAEMILKDGECRITVEKFTKADIPYFVETELEKDPELKKTAESLAAGEEGDAGGENPEVESSSGSEEASGETDITTLKADRAEMEFVNGNARGEVMRTYRDGLYGAVNLEGKEIVPNSYSTFRREPNNEGQFALGNDDNVVVFDKQGNAVMEASGVVSMRIAENTVTYGTVNGEMQTEVCCYDILEGRETMRVELEAQNTLQEPGRGIGVTGLQDGTFYVSYIGNLRLSQMGKDGSTLWTDEELYQELYQIWEEEQEAEESDSDWANAGGMSFFSYEPGYPVQSPNGGYMICAPWMEASVFRLFDCNARRFLEFEMYGVEDNAGWNQFDEFWPQSFYDDGQLYSNKGTQVIMRGTVYEGEEAMDYLIDLSGARTDELGRVQNLSELILAEYPYIRFAGDGYTCASDGEEWFYLDGQGKRMESFQAADCTRFYMGYAMILEDGMAYIVDKNFEKVSEGYPADQVTILGGMFCAVKGDEQTLVIMR